MNQAYAEIQYPRWLIYLYVDDECQHKLERSLESILLQGHVDIIDVWIVKGATSSLNLEKICSSEAWQVLSYRIISTSDISSQVDFNSSRWCSFLRSGDVLHAFCGYKMLKEIALNGGDDVACVYADHDCLNSKGERYSPEFKPQWNIDFFLSSNYLKRAVCILLRGHELSKYLALEKRPEELAALSILGCVYLHSRSDQAIHHVPDVLFGLVGFGRKVTSKSLPASISSFLSSQGVECVYQGRSCSTRLNWRIEDPKPLVSIIIPTKNALKLVKTCVESVLQKTQYSNYELVIVDNQSDEVEVIAYFEKLNEDRRVRVIKYDLPFNYSALNNFAVREASGSLIALVNNDIEVISSDWLSEMVSHALRPGVGCVGAKLLYPDNTIQHGGVIIGYGGVAGHAHKYFPANHSGYMNRLQAVHNVSAVTAACMVVKKSIYEEVGGLNEVDLKVAFNDVDFCLKVLEAGYRNVFTPHAVLYHHESVSRGSDQTGEKRKRFESEIAYMKKRWNTDTWPDPAYNPNLTLAREDFSLRF